MKLKIAVACFLPGRAKDFSAPLYVFCAIYGRVHQTAKSGSFFVMSVCPSVRPSVCSQATTRLPLEELLLNLILENFSKN
jgi:hypothetical protein